MYTVLISIVTGLVAGWVINYLADVLPDTLRLGQPVCSNQDCKKALPWKDYLLLKGCPSCGKKRSWRTFIVILIAVGFALYLWLAPKVPFWVGYPILVYLIIVATIDFEYRLVLRPLSIAGLILCAAAGLVLNGWLSTLIGGVAGFLIMWLFYLLGRWFSRLRAKRMGLEQPDDEEALGSGDVTMATILGVLLGILLAGGFSLVLILFLVISKKYQDQAMNLFIPYVPFFIAAAIILLYLPNWIERLL